MAKTCVNFSKKCGGCPLLALPYPRQTAEKQQRLQKLLGGFAPVAPLRTMAEPWHYRNKAIASFATQQGKLVCGLYAEGTHKVLPSADCLLQNEVLNRTLAAVQDAARACRYTAFDEDKRTGLLRHVVLRCSRKGQVLVTLVTPRPELPGSRNFCAALRKKAPWVVSIVQNINPTLSSAVLGNREKTLYGPGFVLDTLCGLQFAISSRSFYQVNPQQTEVLYRAALDAAQAAQSGACTLREANAAAREANACAKAPFPPAGEAAARACAVAASALWNPASALGMVFYGAAASVYAAHGADLPAQDCDREAQREFAWLLDSLRAASVPDEPNPAKIRWNC